MNSTKEFSPRNLSLWIGSFLAVGLIYHFSHGLGTLVPTDVNWLMSARHDWGTHYLGWYFYRNDDWSFPLGTIQSYYYPVGTNVGFTDSIPLLAIFFKIFSPILPENFQYIGLWLFSCLLLSAYYTILLLRKFGIKDIYIFLIVIFVASNPVLIYRALHPALCAHWLFIAGIYCYVNGQDELAVKKTLLHQYVILLLGATINPYLCFMILGFTFIIPIRQYVEKHLSMKSLTLYIGGSLLSIVVLWYLIGLLTFGANEGLAIESAYGLYSLNLNALVNSWGFSAFLPQLKIVSWHQYEGFMYLGLGIFFLLILSAVVITAEVLQKKTNPALWFRNHRTFILPLLVFAVLLSAFSITNVVSLNDKVLFQIPLPSIIKRLGDIFRASARFFWIPYYLIVIGCLLFIAKSKLNEWIKLTLLAGALLVQVYDVKRLLTHPQVAFGTYAPPLDGKNWSLLMKGFDNIVMYPPFQGTYNTNLDYQDFCFLAAGERKHITTGYVARADNRAVRFFTDSLETNLDAGVIDERTIFVTNAANLNRFSFMLQSGIVKLNVLDNYYYLYSSQLVDADVASLSQKLNDNKKEKLDSAMTAFGKVSPLRKMQAIHLDSGNVINYNFDKYTDTEQSILLAGWAFNSTVDTNKGDSVFIFLQSDEVGWMGITTKALRPDVTSHFKKTYLDDAGFSASISKRDLRKGKFKVGIAIKNANGQLTYQLTNRSTTAGAASFAQLERIESPTSNAEVSQNMDVFEDQHSAVKIAGWAYLKNQDTDGCQINLVLKKDSEFFSCPAEASFRPDVTSYFNNGFNLDNSGYSVRLKKTSLPKGEYQVGIYIKDEKRKTEGFLLTAKKIVF